MPRNISTAKSISEAAQAIAARRGQGDRAAPRDVANLKIVEPTDEQRAGFSEKPVPVRTEKGQVVGRAYRRQPYFVTLAKLPADKAQPKGSRLITAEQFRAMRFYRSAWENTVASETRCALDLSVRGGSGEGATLPQAMWESARVADCERSLAGDLLATLRAIVLHDMSFAAVAMQRWGSRDRQRIIIGKGKEQPRVVNEVVPRSSHHTDRIREDFLEALGHLVASVGRHLAVE